MIIYLLEAGKLLIALVCYDQFY